MKRTIRFSQALLAVLVLTAVAPTASAEWNWKDWWHKWHVTYARNNAWPDPFTELDAYQVYQPFEIMKANGWRMHNTIHNYEFRQGDGALLAAGQQRIHWIATQAPPARRQIFVLKGATQPETEARVASVRHALNNLNVSGPPPEVLITDREPATSSGAWATKINREMLNNIAEPRLPGTSASGQQGVAIPTN